MKKHSSYYFTHIVFTALIVLCCIAAFLPMQYDLRFFVPANQMKNEEDIVLNATGFFSGETVKGKQGITADAASYSIILPESVSDEDYVTVTSANSTLVTFFYRGIGFLKYTNASNLSTYTDVTLSHPENTYFRTMTLSEAVSYYYDQGYVLLFSVKGGGKLGWDETTDALLEQAGIDTTPSDGYNTDGYVAYLYKDQSYAVLGRKTATAYVRINDHRMYLTSAGIYNGNLAQIMVDGTDYSLNGNGVNIVVYDSENDILVDSLSFNTNTTDVMMTRADNLFYTEYTTTVNASYLKQTAMLGKMASIVWKLLFFIAAVILAFFYRDCIVHEHDWMERRKIRKSRIVVLFFIAFLLSSLAFGLVYGYSYLQNNFKQVSLSQLVFHLNTNLDGANWGDFSDLFQKLGLGVLISFAIFLVLVILFIVLLKKVSAERYALCVQSMLVVRWTWLIVSIVIISLVINQFWWSYDVYGFLVNNQFEAEVFDDYYVDPTSVQISFPEEKKNLIYIFMESMEITSADEVSGGGKSFNAIPELTELALEYDNFNGDSTVLNGGTALTNGTWTIAGIVSQTSGLPLEIDHSMSNIRGTVTDFMPGATTIGDILAENGYNQVFMLGSDSTFGNRKQYFTEHGDYEVEDLYWARQNGLIPYNYYVWWGYEDGKLFEFAKDEATSLAEKDEPFNLTLLTVDTHFTDGYLCEDCPDTYTDQYSNVIACSSSKIAEFVAWVQQQPWGEDTVIVLSGDHLCMDSNYYSDIPENYDRKTFVTIINSQKEEPGDVRDFATIDLFPTTLSAMGVEIEGDRLGLGTDLYSDTPTLVEEMGTEWLNNEFSMRSSFYENNILYPDTAETDE